MTNRQRFVVPVARLILVLALIGSMMPRGSDAQSRPHLVTGDTRTVPNTAPVVDLNGNDSGIDFAATFAGGGGAIAIVDADASDGEALTVSDDKNLLIGATIRLTNNLDGVAETLAVNTAGTPIVATLGGAAASRTLTLSGLASRSQYEQVLRTATYNNTAEAPDITQRTIEFRTNDSQTLSAVAVSRVTIPNPVPLTAVVSRKTHGSAGVFEIDLLASNPVECRSPGSGNTHVLVFRFVNPISSVGSVAVTGTGNVTSAAVGTDQREFIVTLNGVTDMQRVAVQLRNVADNTGNRTTVSAIMGVLLGDTNGSGIVNASDIGQVKASSGLPLTSSNFRSDVVVNGAINATDIGQVKARSGNALPASAAAEIPDTEP